MTGRAAVRVAVTRSQATGRRNLLIAAWRKQRGVCHYCNRTVARSDATLEHIVPRSAGGPDERWNVVMACRSCNNGLGNQLHKCGCSVCSAAQVKAGRRRG